MATGEVGGAAAAYAGGSSSSLHKEYKPWKQSKNKATEELKYNTYVASIS
jgi:hypothetical protein